MGLIGFDKLSRRHAVSGLKSPTNLEEFRCRDVVSIREGMSGEK